MSETVNSLSITIPTYGRAVDPRNRPFCVYVLDIKFGNDRWEVYRRFQAFRSLHDQLKRLKHKIPDCPSKNSIKAALRQSPEFLHKRRVALEDWIHKLLQNPTAIHIPIFQEFLQIEANRPPTGLVLADPPVETTTAVEVEDEPRPAGKIGLSDFILLKVIGKGSFGKVFQVRKKDNDVIYAMKVLDKKHVIDSQQVEHTMTERGILGKVAHPFIVKLHYAFQCRNKLYFVLDYCVGGELFFHLGKCGQFPEDRAKFYTAELALAIEHCHTNDVIYRDLKPENVMLDAEGHIKLTDFGLSKMNIQSNTQGANSFCGTAEYLAPEVLTRQGHGRAVDWWSLGTLLYEMLTGWPPFCSDNVKDIFDQIKNGRFSHNDVISDVAWDLLTKLLHTDPSKRLGCGPEDAAEIKNHPFFMDIDWTALLRRDKPAPWIPDLKNLLDTSQFSCEFTDLPIRSPPQRRGRMDSLDVGAMKFNDFSFQPSFDARGVQLQQAQQAQQQRTKLVEAQEEDMVF